MFPKASTSNAFFALTSRAAGNGDTPGPLLMGQAVMKNHKLDGISYEPDGWWAVLTQDGVPVPADEAATIDDFCATWRVERRTEPGLSVIIPYADESLTFEQLRRSVVRDFFVAILSGQLIADIEGDGHAVTINPETLDEVIQLLDEDDRTQVRRDAHLVRWALGLGEDKVITLQAPTGAPSWTRDLIASEAREAIRETLADDRPVLVRAPVTITLDNGGSRASSFDVLLAPEEQLRRLPVFVREGIIVSEAVHRGALHGVRAIVLVGEGALADLLGDAEGPAHTAWSEKTDRFRGQYRYGPRWLTFVKQAPRWILEIARGDDEEEDRTVAIDYFSIPVDESGEHNDDGQQDDGDEESPPPPPPPPRGNRKIAVSRAGDGFTVTLTSRGTDVQRFEVVTAYDRTRGDAFKRWTREDFDLADMDVRVVGGTLRVRDGNRLVVDVADHAPFSLRVRGFDVNRDVRVHARERDVV